MQDEPGAIVLIEAIQDFLMKEVLPTMEGGGAYKTLVSWNSLGMIAREIRDEEGIVQGELKLLNELFEVGPEDGSEKLAGLQGKKEELGDLNRRLVARIRTGKLDVDAKDEWNLVRDMVANRIVVVNPRYKLS